MDEKKTAQESKTDAGKAKSEMIKIRTKASVCWNKPAPDPKLMAMESFRSMPELKKHMEKTIAEHPDMINWTIDINLIDADDSDRKINVASGTVEAVLKILESRIMPAGIAIAQLQLIASRIAEISDLKGVILTAVFGEGAAAGFGMISESSKVDDTDMVVLGEAAAHQVDMFKDAMHKKGIKFPTDSGIIIPGNFKK